MVKRRKRQAGIDPDAPEEQPICKQLALVGDNELGDFDDFKFNFHFDINSQDNIPAVTDVVMPVSPLRKPVIRPNTDKCSTDINEIENNEDVLFYDTSDYQEEEVFHDAVDSDDVHCWST